MKYIVKYNNFNNLNEKYFSDWLIQSRSISDLLSVKRVIKISKKIAELKYKLELRKLEIRNDRTEKGLSPDLLTQNELVELKSYANEYINLEKQLKKRYEYSDYLMYVMDLVLLEEENKYIIKLRKIAIDNDTKKNLDSISDINDEKINAVTNQIKLGNNYNGNYNSIESEIDKRKQKEYQDEINRLNIEKQKMQNLQPNKPKETKPNNTQQQKVTDYKITNEIY